jgi:hypothetical protein
MITSISTISPGTCVFYLSPSVPTDLDYNELGTRFLELGVPVINIVNEPHSVLISLTLALASFKGLLGSLLTHGIGLDGSRRSDIITTEKGK